jgi:uncharacterized SAM-binding protein YcdF (DUF218 family)
MVQDPLQSATAIVILGGQVPFRAMEAASVYRGGWAPEVWITRRASRPEDVALARLGVGATPEDDYSQQVLEKLGVPSPSIRRLDETVQNTADEVRVIVKEMQKISASRVIIVTSKFHTRRVRVLWDALSHDHSMAIVRYASSDPADVEYWWRTTTDATAVARELLGLLNAWTGLPLKPHPNDPPTH